jgi:hypothetical protein
MCLERVFLVAEQLPKNETNPQKKKQNQNSRPTNGQTKIRIDCQNRRIIV